MRVAQRVHELAGRELRHLRHHQREQRVGRDIEGHAQKDVRRALIELAGEPALGDVELEQAVAWRQRHAVDVGWIPGADDEAARIRIAADGLHHIGDLIDGAAVAGRPRPPLPPVDRAELTHRIRPFVPDRDAVVVEIFDVGVPREEPQQLVDNRLEVQLLGRDQREALRQIEPHLVAEYGQRAGAGAVVLLRTVGEYPLHQLVILVHSADIGLGAARDKAPTRGSASLAPFRRSAIRRRAPAVNSHLPRGGQPSVTGDLPTSAVACLFCGSGSFVGT